jgi:hypothetical protein
MMKIKVERERKGNLAVSVRVASWQIQGNGCSGGGGGERARVCQTFVGSTENYSN